MYTGHMQSMIKPLWLVVPASYPFSSPVILDHMPLEVRLETMINCVLLHIYTLKQLFNLINSEYLSSCVCIII